MQAGIQGWTSEHILCLDLTISLWQYKGLSVSGTDVIFVCVVACFVHSSEVCLRGEGSCSSCSYSVYTVECCEVEVLSSMASMLTCRSSDYVFFLCLFVFGQNMYIFYYSTIQNHLVGKELFSDSLEKSALHSTNVFITVFFTLGFNMITSLTGDRCFHLQQAWTRGRPYAKPTFLERNKYAHLWSNFTLIYCCCTHIRFQ